MCMLDVVAYHRCGHAELRCFRCNATLCSFEWMPRYKYDLVDSCPACQAQATDAQSGPPPTPHSPGTLSQHRQHFFRQYACTEMRYEQLRLAREAVCQERIRERERAAHVAGHEQAVAEAQEHLTDVAAEWEIAHRALDAKYVEGQSISESIAVLREIVTAAERLYEAEVTLLAALDDLTTIRDRDPLEMLSRPEVDAGSIAGALRAADGKPFLFDSDELFCPVDDTELPEGFEHSCAICHEPFGISNSEDAIIEHPVRLPCHASHIFGSVCLHSWIAEEKSCPMCRARFAIVEAKEPEGLDRVRLELIEEALVLGFPAGILEGLVGADGKIWEDANAHEKVHAFREIEPWDHDVIFGYAQPGSELDDPVGVSLFCEYDPTFERVL